MQSKSLALYRKNEAVVSRMFVSAWVANLVKSTAFCDLTRISADRHMGPCRTHF